MSNWLALSLTLLLLADADVPRVNSLRPPASPAPSFPSYEEIPLFPNTGESSDNAQSQNQSQSKTAPAAKKDRKSTRLNSSHANISYAVFCLKKKKMRRRTHTPPQRSP